MTERNASEIRAYLAEDMKLHDFVALVEVDLPRVLEAATYRGHALRRILAYCDDLEIVRSWATNALADTAFLEDSPAEPVSPNDENGGESETLGPLERVWQEACESAAKKRAARQ